MPAVMLSRRMFSSLLIGGSVGAIGGSVSNYPMNLTYRAGLLSWPGGDTCAVCGKGGVRPNKREGDGASPAGTFPLLYGYYRPDRLKMPQSGLRMTALRPEDGWVDDPADPNYNRPVKLPYPARHEELWRADGLYDVIVVIGYNTGPVVPGAGSAIFLHVARPDLTPTEGCIAVGRAELVGLLPLLGPGSTITIAA